VIVTAGPTREHLDPVRVLTNSSSGRMGYALAEAAYARGADVVLVTGPTELLPPDGVATQRVESTAELQRAVQGLMQGAHALFMAAAPADYRPKTAAKTKRPRSEGSLTLELEPTPDILASLERPKGCLVIGFALETGNGLARARQKLQDKSLDFVVLNDALEPGAGFEVTTNRVTVLGKGGRQVDLPLLPKRDVAERILDAVEEAL
jgi:phosphopantothenoylcysteine decarboxylase/phosphopantothenate--cysteine ligase